MVRTEEGRFGSTLKQAFVIFEQIAQKSEGAGVIQGADAFKLYDTYGLALDFTEELAKDRGLRVDKDGFERELEAQQERARQSSKMGAVTGDPMYLGLLQQHGKTGFTGYEGLAIDDARVLAVVKDGAPVKRLDKGQEGGLLLDRTPFYANSGGQVGDHGVISAEGSTAEVVDATLPVPGLYLHHVRVTAGGFEAGMTVHAQVDRERRSGARRHHTATHLLHAALREQLGPHVKQAGSLVAPDRLRFDFSHFAGVDPRGAADAREPRERGDPEVDAPHREGHGTRGGAQLRRARVLRRQVRRARARGRDPRVLQGVLRRHARGEHRRDRAVPPDHRGGRLRGNPPRGGPHRRGRASRAPRRIRPSWTSWSSRPRRTGASWWTSTGSCGTR